METSLQRGPDGGVEPFPTGPLCGPPWPPGHLGHGRAPPPALVPQGCPDPLAPAPPQVAFCPGHINLCPGQLAEAGGQTGQIPRACRQSGCRVTPNSPGPGLQRAEGGGQRGELPCVSGPSGIWRGGGCLDPSRSPLQVNWLSLKLVSQWPCAAQGLHFFTACSRLPGDSPGSCQSPV